MNGAYVASPSAHSTPYMDASAYPPPISEDGYVASHTRQSSLDFGLDFDFEGEAGVPAEEVVPELSLGLIIWHPAIPTSKPLPSVFDDVEPTWTESVKATEDAHISVTSEFFPDDMSVDIRLSVRDTDEWEKVKDDLIFVEFGKTAVTVPVRTVIANRDRPDPVTDQLEPVTQDNVTALVSHPEALMQQAVAGAYEDQSDGDQAMDMSDDEDVPAKPVLQPVIQPLAHPLPRPVAHVAPPVKQVTILDTLEQALGPKSPRKNDRQSSRASARYSRSRSPEKRSRQGSQQPKAKPAPLPKDSAQENILAALGVEGSPKMVYPTPPPALGLPVPPTNRYVQFSGGITFYDLTYGSKKITPPGAFGPAGQRFAYGPQFPPPPPPRESRSPSFDPWRAHDPASPKSTTSQHTAVGSDFHPDDVMVDLDATPKAKAPVAPEKSGSGRKRTYEEVAAAEGRRRQDDDTPRAHRMRRSRQDVYRYVPDTLRYLHAILTVLAVAIAGKRPTCLVMSERHQAQVHFFCPPFFYSTSSIRCIRLMLLLFYSMEMTYTRLVCIRRRTQDSSSILAGGSRFRRTKARSVSQQEKRQIAGNNSFPSLSTLFISSAFNFFFLFSFGRMTSDSIVSVAAFTSRFFIFNPTITEKRLTTSLERANGTMLCCFENDRR